MREVLKNSNAYYVIIVQVYINIIFITPKCYYSNHYNINNNETV